MQRRDFLKAAGVTAAGMAFTANVGSVTAAELQFEQAPLVYKLDALVPLFSEEQVTYHYLKHHASYFTNLKGLVAGKPEEKLPLEAIIIQARGDIRNQSSQELQAAATSLFNNAAQLWNHNFFWNSLVPNGGGKPTGDLAEAIDRDFGDFEKFKEAFISAATKQFASGWGWLVKDAKTGKLSITTTSNAETPLGTDKMPLLTADVWEHTYYVDYRNRRADYLKAFFDKVNWAFAQQNFAARAEV